VAENCDVDEDLRYLCRRTSVESRRFEVGSAACQEGRPLAIWQVVERRR
jgi:hypothetical protein